MIVPDPNMFGGSVLSKKLGSKWRNYKTNKMILGKLIYEPKVQEQMNLLLMQIIEV